MANVRYADERRRIVPEKTKKKKKRRPVSVETKWRRHKHKQVLKYTERDIPWDEFEDAILDHKTLQRFCQPFLERYLKTAGENLGRFNSKYVKCATILLAKMHDMPWFGQMDIEDKRWFRCLENVLGDWYDFLYLSVGLTNDLPIRLFPQLPVHVVRKENIVGQATYEAKNRDPKKRGNNPKIRSRPYDSDKFAVPWADFVRLNEMYQELIVVANRPHKHPAPAKLEVVHQLAYLVDHVHNATRAYVNGKSVRDSLASGFSDSRVASEDFSYSHESIWRRRSRPGTGSTSRRTEQTRNDTDRSHQQSTTTADTRPGRSIVATTVSSWLGSLRSLSRRRPQDPESTWSQASPASSIASQASSATNQYDQDTRTGFHEGTSNVRNAHAAVYLDSETEYDASVAGSESLWDPEERVREAVERGRIDAKWDDECWERGIGYIKAETMRIASETLKKYSERQSQGTFSTAPTVSEVPIEPLPSTRK